MAASGQEWISKRAYSLWEEEGYPSGKDRQHWERACLEYAALRSPRREETAGLDDAAPSPVKSRNPSRKADTSKASTSKTGAAPAKPNVTKADKPVKTPKRSAPKLN